MPDQPTSPPRPGSLISWVNSGILYRRESGRCPVCGNTIDQTSQLFVCPRCTTPHHLDCFEYNQRCGVFGCHRMDAPRRSVPPGLREDASPPASGPWFTFWNLIVVVALIGVLAAIAVPNFKSRRYHSPMRSCYANQKTVAGAIEMYNLDKNTKRTVLDSSLWRSLKSGGYLQCVPQDPGFGGGSSSHYQWTAMGNGIRCTIHGFIQQ